jgi:pimeloyl-ACP methyl ester carboxylesterase
MARDPQLLRRRTLVLGAGGGFLAACTEERPAPRTTTANPLAGAVALHGKTSSPSLPMTQAMARTLRNAGITVVTPTMGFARDHYLTGSVSDAHDQIAAEIARLRAAGARRVLLAGHSMGGNAALSFAVRRGGVDGLLLYAPGHNPQGSQRFPEYRAALERARAMVAAGRGREIGTFADVSEARFLTPQTHAADWLSWMDPDGDGQMTVTAPALPATIPLFVAIGTRDLPAINRTAEAAFAAAPRHPLSRLLTVDADHYGVPAAADGAARAWIASVLASAPAA